MAAAPIPTFAPMTGEIFTTETGVVEDSQITFQYTNGSRISIRIGVEFVTTTPNYQRWMIAQTENILNNLRFPYVLGVIWCILVANRKILPNHDAQFVAYFVETVRFNAPAAPNTD